MLDLLAEELILAIAHIVSNDEMAVRHGKEPSRAFYPHSNSVMGKYGDSLAALSCVSQMLRRIVSPILFETVSIAFEDNRWIREDSHAIEKGRIALDSPRRLHVKC